MQPKLRLLMVSPQCDGEDVGENRVAFQLIKRLAARTEMTLLTCRFSTQVPPSKQISGARVVEFSAFPHIHRKPRFNSTVKPWQPLYALRARSYIKKALDRGERFDVAHHLTPMAMRFPSPLVGLKIPYLIGPCGGSVPTPPGMASELGTEPGFVRIRNLDAWRIRHDPLLRRTFTDAAIVVGVGPYVKDHLADLQIKSFVFEPEAAVSAVKPPRPRRERKPGELRLLYLSRVVRTKGLRDAIRSLSRLSHFPLITLDVGGAGEDLAECQREAFELGVADRVRFHGKIEHKEVDRYYQQADAFVFPSFREPTGMVLFEAMSHGLPVIAADAGGPASIVTDDCGFRIQVKDPVQFASDIAEAIRLLATNDDLLDKLSSGARKRCEAYGLWDEKIDRLIALYHDLAASSRPEP
jgi:glycosyltransferase involved in cell wall biosynthesis